MNHEQLQNLLSEKSFLEEQLTELPAAAKLTRTSTEWRLAQINGEIQKAKVARIPGRVRITFRGPHVRDGQGISTKFAKEAIGKFEAAVATTVSSLGGPLHAMGRLPNRTDLMITSTALGSFGFDLEEVVDGQLSLEESPVAIALTRLQKLLRGTQCTPDDLAESACEIDSRVIASVRAFLEFLAENDSTFATRAGGEEVRFDSLIDVRKGVESLKEDNLREEVRTFDGVFLGVLPGRRQFEFRTENGDVLFGKIAAAVTYPESLNAHLNQPTRVELQVTTVRTTAAKYLLLERPVFASPRAE